MESLTASAKDAYLLSEVIKVHRSSTHPRHAHFTKSPLDLDPLDVSSRDRPRVPHRQVSCPAQPLSLTFPRFNHSLPPARAIFVELVHAVLPTACFNFLARCSYLGTDFLVGRLLPPLTSSW